MLRASLALLVVFSSACAGRTSTSGGAPAPAPEAVTVMQRAAAAQPPAPRNVDPVGTYEVETMAEGATVKFTTKILRNTDGSLGGVVTSQVYGEMPISSVAVSGKTVSFTLATGDGILISVKFTLEGDQVTGEWSSGNDGWTIRGRKLP
jgi:hypothetical protein